jgi:hypothetical protein
VANVFDLGQNSFKPGGREVGECAWTIYR